MDIVTCPFRTVCTGYDATNVFVVLPSQEASCGVTINEILGRELSMTTSQTDNISWLFEVSVNVGVSVCVVEKGKEGGWGGGGTECPHYMFRCYSYKSAVVEIT